MQSYVGTLHLKLWFIFHTILLSWVNRLAIYEHREGRYSQTSITVQEIGEHPRYRVRVLA